MTETLDRLRGALSRRYVIERELGRGGMSIVYVARDLRHNRDVAIKVFPPALAAAIGSERFEREIEITSKLSHPHILPLFDSGEAAGALYYVMPLIEGRSLRDLLDQSPDGVPVQEAISLGDQVAQALDYAHSLGVIHRDVTPDNILISNGNALLADFGVARLVEGETMTESGLPFGTAMYRSPEQASGHARVGPESDVYSLACVMYECIGGAEARPHLANRFATPVPLLRKRKREVSPSLDAAVAKAMSLDPADRFRSALDFVRACRSRRSFRYSWHSITRAALVLMIVGIGAAGFSVFRRRVDSTLPKRVLVGRFANRTGDKSLDALSDMTTDYIARGLAQTGLLEVVDSRTVGSVSPASTGAATFVQGNIYKRGDQLHLETRITDPRTGKVLIATDPIEAPASSATALAEQLRQKLMGNFLALFGPGFEAWEAASLPPSFEAYQEIIAGDAAIGANDYRGALEHYRRSAAMDSTYAGAKALAAVAAAIGLFCDTEDSLVRSLRPRLKTLQPLDRGRVEWADAQCRGDIEGSFTAGKRVIASAPRSIFFNLLTGVTALELLRPREAIDILTSLSPRQMQFSAAQRQFHTSFIAIAWHELDEHQRELAVFRDALSVMPDEPHFISGELVALAALGKKSDIDRLLSQYDAGKAHYDRELWNPGILRVCAGTELKAHGFDLEGNALLAEGALWSRSHLPKDGSIPVDVVCSHRLFVPTYYGDMFGVTRSFYENVLAHDSLNVEAHEALGALAAHRHDAASMTAMDTWLASHSSAEPGRTAYSRARIAAISGRHSRAMTLLAESMRKGLKNRMNVHADPDLAPLRNLPEYRRLFAIRS